MGGFLEHKPGERVTLDGKEYDVLWAPRLRPMCFMCAFNDEISGEGAWMLCMKVQCNPEYRKDKNRVYYREVKNN